MLFYPIVSVLHFLNKSVLVEYKISKVFDVMALLHQFSVQSMSGLIAQKVIFIFKELQQTYGTIPPAYGHERLIYEVLC